jgi:Glycosyl transferase family 4 group
LRCTVDPEFSRAWMAVCAGLRLKNSVHRHAVMDSDGGCSPSAWQHRQSPAPRRGRFEVIVDGIGMVMVQPESGGFGAAAARRRQTGAGRCGDHLCQPHPKPEPQEVSITIHPNSDGAQCHGTRRRRQLLGNPTPVVAGYRCLG